MLKPLLYNLAPDPAYSNVAYDFARQRLAQETAWVSNVILSKGVKPIKQSHLMFDVETRSGFAVGCHCLMRSK